MHKTPIIVILLITFLCVLGACTPEPAPAPASPPAPAPAPAPAPVPAPAPIPPAPTEPEEEPEPAELKYDDGTSNGKCSSGQNGFLVLFSPSETPFTINAVKIYSSLQGTGYENQKPNVEIWDKDFALLHSWQEPATGFTKDPGWVTVDIPDITVDDDFNVVFYTNSEREGGVYLHFNSSALNKYSETVDPGGTITDWVWQQSKDKTNWMIRVMGTPAEEGTPVTSPLTSPTQTMEISAEFQDTISTLDSPQKLSQWMIENIKGESYYEREKESETLYTPNPQETFETRSGNCRVFSVFACYILQYHGYEAEVLGIKVESDESMNHAVCVYHSDGLLYVINNGRMEGPFQNYEDISSAHHEGWSSYEIHYLWENYQQLKRPDEIVYRE